MELIAVTRHEGTVMVRDARQHEIAPVGPVHAPEGGRP